MTFHLVCVHIIFVRFGLLSGHLLEKSCYFSLYISKLFTVLDLRAEFGF